MRVTIEGPNQVGGYPDGDALVARYAERSGRDVGDIDFYVAFARWRAACIQAGVYSRYEGGALGEGEGETAADRLDGVYVQAQAAYDALA